MKKLSLTFILMLLCTVMSFGETVLNYDKLAPHPRLLLQNGDIDAMKEFYMKSNNAKLVHDKILSECDAFLSQEPVERVVTGRRLLSVSREALKRIFYLSYAHLMTQDIKYATRAEKEMVAICEFQDWNPSHFLDVAEMTMGLAIGYDWLYPHLSDMSRDAISTAIYEKGLRPSENTKQAWFFTATKNWNQVCNASMIYGALVIMERYPEYCKSLIDKCLKSNPISQQCYEPDGVYPEGYGYWDYGTGFEVMLVAALQSALGTDAGIASQKSFMDSAEFMTYMVAPSGKCYNFADSGSGANCIPSKYWFARQLNNASLVVTDEMLLANGKVPNDRLLPIYMIFGSALDFNNQSLPKKKVWVGQGEVPIYLYRSGWTHPEDTYFAMKGGHASTNHAHMDAGSFVYEWKGVRWSVDLGMHNYHTLEKSGVDLWNRNQKSGRWEVFRISPHAHGVLTFNGKDHQVNGIATMTKSSYSPERKEVEFDLSPTYQGQAKEVKRKAVLDANDLLTITDFIVAGDESSQLEWKISTLAEPKIIGSDVIMLTQSGKTMYLKLKGVKGAEAKIWPEHNYMDFELRDKGLSRVGFVLPLKANQRVELEVRFQPTR